MRDRATCSIVHDARNLDEGGADPNVQRRRQLGVSQRRTDLVVEPRRLVAAILEQRHEGPVTEHFSPERHAYALGDVIDDEAQRDIAREGKAGVKALTEGLAYTLREKGTAVSAHLLIPGFTYTGMIARRLPEKPAAAWTSEQVVDFMLESLQRGDFYILCPGKETTRAQDEKRIAWIAGDLIENRPALSRWHPEWKATFARYMVD